MEIGEFLITIKEINKQTYSITCNEYNEVIKSEKTGIIKSNYGDKVLITDKKDGLLEIFIDNKKVYFSLYEENKLYDFYENYFMKYDKFIRMKKLEKLKTV